jgi:hypothetical protein
VPLPVARLVDMKSTRPAPIGSRGLRRPQLKLSFLVVKITGAPMRELMSWIVRTNETMLDVAVDSLVAILGASFLTGFLYVVIEAL